MKILLIAIALLAVPVLAIVGIGMSLPQVHVAERSVVFPTHNQSEVWNVISGSPTWRPEVTKFEALPERNGHPMWREYGSDGQSIAYERTVSEAPRKMVVRIAEQKLPYSGTWTYELEPAGQGSRLTITEAGEVYNPIFRFVSRYIIGQTATIDAYFKALSAKLK